MEQKTHGQCRSHRRATARRLGAAGLMSMSQVIPQRKDYEKRVVVVMGTVLDIGEKVTDDRVRETAGPIVGAHYHLVWTTQDPDKVVEMPGSKKWLEVINRAPQRQRHLSIHNGHLLAMNEADTAGWNAG
jgi:Flp pilus assembly protein CpaB